MRDRLIELLCEGMAEVCGAECSLSKNTYCTKCTKAADYLLENGVIVPPCKVGDVVYCLVDCFKEPMEAKIYSITAQNNAVIMRCGVKGYYGVSYMATDFGRKFFKSKEAAEAALKERERG